MASSLLGLGLLLAGGLVQAQPPAAPADQPIFRYSKPAARPSFDERILRVGGQQPPVPPPPAPGAAGEDVEYQIQLIPPGPKRFFRLESEAHFQERMRQEALSRPNPERIEFPKDYKPLSKQPYVARAWPPLYEIVEPAYVCYRRLGFEDINSERYGWDLGFVQPFVSAGKFFCDVATPPYRWAKEPCRHYECSAGYCLPGDAVPYLCYPVGISGLGAAAEAGAVLAILAIFP